MEHRPCAGHTQGSHAPVAHALTVVETYWFSCPCTQEAHHLLLRCDTNGEPWSGRTEVVQEPAGSLVATQDSSMHSRLSEADGEMCGPGGWHIDGTANVYTTSGHSSREEFPCRKGVQLVMHAHFLEFVSTSDRDVRAPADVCCAASLEAGRHASCSQGLLPTLCCMCGLVGDQECWCTTVCHRETGGNDRRIMTRHGRQCHCQQLHDIQKTKPAMKPKHHSGRYKDVYECTSNVW
jgi:hypothetical protein